MASRARPIQPKGLAQKRYVDAIREKDIVFGIGPAGTGKTYLNKRFPPTAASKTQNSTILPQSAVWRGKRNWEIIERCASRA